MTYRVPTASLPRPWIGGHNGVNRVPNCVPVPIKGRRGRGTRQAQDDPQKRPAGGPSGRETGRDNPAPRATILARATTDEAQSPPMARTYTDAEKADARASCLDIGMDETHKATGIPKSTLSSWLTPDERTTMHARFTSKTDAARDTHAQVTAAQRQSLAADLLGDVQRLRAQLFAPCVERKVVTLSGSKDEVGTWELVDIERDQPTFGEQKAIMTTLAIAVDKIQILTGEATERIEHRAVPDRTPDQERELAKVLELKQRAA